MRFGIWMEVGILEKSRRLRIARISLGMLESPDTSERHLFEAFVWSLPLCDLRVAVEGGEPRCSSPGLLPIALGEPRRPRCGLACAPDAGFVSTAKRRNF